MLVVDENVRVPLYPTTNNQDDWATLARRFPFSYYAIAAAVRNLSPTPTITWTQTMGASLDAILADLKSPFVSHSHTSLTRPPPAPAPCPRPTKHESQPTDCTFFLVGRNISAHEALYKSSPTYDFLSSNSSHSNSQKFAHSNSNASLTGPNQPRVQPSGRYLPPLG